MAEKKEKAFNPEETTWQRGWTDALKWIGNHALIWYLTFSLPAIGGAVLSYLTPGNSFVRVAIYGLVAGIGVALLLFLVLLLWYLPTGVKRQRDEARIEFLKKDAIVKDDLPKLEQLKSCTSRLVDLQAKYKGLLQTYQPELGGIKSGDTVRGRQFNLSLLFNQLKTSVISGVTFENCTFVGPAVVLLLGNGELTGISFSGNIENVVVKADPGKGYLGMCALLNCKIRNCKFENVGILGDEELKEKLKPPTPNPQPPNPQPPEVI